MYSLDSEAVQPYNPTTSLNVAPDGFNVSLGGNRMIAGLLELAKQV
jgi:hypothetical protein